MTALHLPRSQAGESGIHPGTSTVIKLIVGVPPQELRVQLAEPLRLQPSDMPHMQAESRPPVVIPASPPVDARGLRMEIWR